MADFLANPLFRAVDTNGLPYNGAKAYFYRKGTTTATTVYQDAAAQTPHAQPVVADSAGLFAPIYVPDPANTKLVLQTSAGGAIQTIDPLAGGTSAGLSVSSYGAKGDGSTDDLAAIQAAINAGKTYAQYTGGAVEIYFPAGVYLVSATIDLSACHGLQLRGAGNQATEIKASGTTYPVFTLTGTSGAALQSVTIRDMLIYGGGAANASAHGIKATYTNSCVYENLKFYGCRAGLYFTKAWQDRVNNCHVVGTGAFQNYDGIYMAETDALEPNNAIIVNGFYAENYQHAGLRIINGQGSKFVNGECSGGAYGVYAGAPTTGTYWLEFLHFANWLCDSCSSHGWYFAQGTASQTLRHIQLANVWSGNQGDSGFWVEGASDFILTGVQSHGNNKSGVVIYNSTECVLQGAVMGGNNVGNDATAADVLLNNSTYTIVCGVKSNPAHQKSLLEAGTANANLIFGNQFIDGATLLGTTDRVFGNRGTMQGSTTNDPASIASASRDTIKTMTVTGAVVGDHVEIAFSNDLQGLIMNAWVSAADTVSYQFSNPTAGTIDLALGTVWASVSRLHG